MKTKLSLTLLFFILIAFTIEGQVPQGFNYQAVVRDAMGNLVINKDMQVKIAILSDTTGFYASGTGTYVWEELHSVKTNAFGMITLVIGSAQATKVQGSAASFSAIPWTTTQLFVGTKVSYPGWRQLGSAKLWSVPYAIVAEKANGVNAGAKLSITSANDLGTDALFEVKRQDGQPVFAVYPDAVNIWVPQSGAKGPKGGFSVGGYGTTRGDTYDFFRVTPDSVRIYIDPTPDAKGAKGGFAVGGYGASKGINDMYFNLTGTTEVSTVNASPQILWYPTKNAFLAGNVHIGSADSVGDYSTALGYQSIAMGDYSQAFGYRAKAFGDYSTSIGKNSIAGSKVPAANNAFAFGDASSATGSDSYAFGSGAVASGTRSFAFGSVGLDDSQVPTSNPTRATGNYSVALGMGASALNTGAMSLGVGSGSSGIASTTLGFYSLATGSFGTALGYKTVSTGAYSLAAGSNSVAAGDNSLAIGTYGLNTDGTVNTARPTKTFLSYSIAFGMGAQANLKGDMALGVNTTSQGGYSTAMGYGASASGQYAISLGYNTQATAVNSASFGSTTQATASNALALGTGSIASGTNSTAMGYQSQSKGDKSIAIGSYYSYSSIIPIITLGKGEEPKGEDTDETKGLDDFLVIRPITPITNLTRVFNRANIAEGQYSVAVGNGNLAQNGGLVFGSNSDAIKFGALALGTSASAVENNSIAMGYNSTANGIYSVAIGNNVTANSYGEISIGQWNESISGTYDTWNDNELLFTVGNGVNNDNRSNALTMYKNGKTIIRGRYAVSTFNYKRARLVSFSPIIIKDYVYGIYTYLNRDEPAIEYYYSGWFGASGTSGTYYGLYADTRSGGSIDVAEYIYDTKVDTEPADVVVVDALNKESVIKSSEPYQTSVAGVISTKPHMTMGMELVVDEKTGEPLPNAKPAARLALTGRVPVKVTGENGAIVPGDLLTTSSTPGHAMKWSLMDVNKAKDFEEMKAILAENEKRRNAVIGKAVEAFPGSGTGKIMVLISLQ